MRKLFLVVSVVAALSGCNCGPECPAGTEEGPEVSLDLSSFRGLWTSPVDTDTDPAHLAVADNVAFYRPGMPELRRGFEALSADLGTGINRVAVFEDTLIAHHGTASISRWTGSAWVAYSGTFTPPTGVKVRFFEAQESLFVTTADGIYELDSPTGTWRLTGSPPGLQGVATLRRTSDESGGFTEPDGQWAFRLVWGYKNANNRLQLGAPSGRFLLTVPADLEVQAANISKTSGSSVVTVDGVTHGLTTGEYIDVTLGGSETNFVGGDRFQVTVTDSNTFTYDDGGASGFTGNPSNPISYGFTSRNADITAYIPAGITSDHFLQVYRSVKSASASTEPNDALALVYERSPTNLEITNGSMSVTDITPDELRGAALYTSVGTILDAKYRPPACKDAVEFRSSVFCAATHLVQSLELSILGAGGDTGVQLNDAILFSDMPDDQANRTWFYAFTFSSTESAGTPKLYTDGSASQNVANTAQSLVRAINTRAGNTHLYAEYVSTDTEAPGRIRVYGQSPTVTEFTAYFNPPSSNTSGAAFVPRLPTARGVDTIARASNVVTVDTTQAHGYAVGQQVEFIRSSDTTDFPNGIKTVASTPSADTFTYAENGSNVAAEANGGFFANQAVTLVTSDNTERANGLMWSASGEPWAFPLTNLVTVGTGEVKRVVPTRDRLMVLTTRGTYQVTGEFPGFALQEYDTTLSIKAYDTAVAQGGKVYGLFDSGFVEMLESARIADYAINKDVRDLMASSASTVSTYAFAVPYESENMVLFFLPDSSDDTANHQAYVLKTDTGDWTRWPIANVRHGVVSPADDKLYLGLSTGATWKERKARVAADHQDPGGTAISAVVESIAQDAGEPNSQKVWSGGSFTFRDSQFASVGLAFKTDLSPTLSTAMTMAPPGGASSNASVIDFWVPRSWMRGTRMAWRMTHAVASERWALQGLSVQFRVCSPMPKR